MANDETIFREVDQGVAEDRLLGFAKQHASLVIGAGAAIVVAVGGWQIWSAQSASAAAKGARSFHAAVSVNDEDAGAGAQAFDQIIDNGAPGYRVLASFRRAAQLADGGDAVAARAAYQQIYKDGGAPKRLQQLARLRAAYLALDIGRDETLADLGELTQDESAMGHYAREAAALAALTAGDYQTASAMFKRAASDLTAPGAVRQRAEEFAPLAAAAKAGVDISLDIAPETEVSLDSLVDALGRDDGDISEEGAIDEAASEVETTASDEATTAGDAASDGGAVEQEASEEQDVPGQAGAAPAPADLDDAAASSPQTPDSVVPAQDDEGLTQNEAEGPAADAAASPAAADPLPSPAADAEASNQAEPQ